MTKNALRLSLTAIIALACATPVFADPGSPAGAPATSAPALDPPAPPKDAAPDQLKAWQARYIQAGAYVEAVADANRLVLYDPTTLQKQPDGHVIGWFRTELFRPRLADGLNLRSVRKKLELDCDGQRYKELVVEGYAASNMQQPVAGVPVLDAWTSRLPDEGSAAISLHKACDAARGS